jgi:phosphate transport system permease protein
VTLAAPISVGAAVGRGPKARKPLRRRTSLFAYGEPMVWLTGGTLVLSLVMIAGLLGLVLWFGAGTFWPQPLTRLELADGTALLGEVTDHETYDLPHAADGSVETAERTLIRIGNFELTGRHFAWVSDFELARGPAAVTYPEWDVAVERMTWGRFYGTPTAFRVDGEDVATTPEEVWRAFEAEHAASRERFEERRALETHDVGRVNRRLEDARLELREAELEHGDGSPAWQAAKDAFDAAEQRANEDFAELAQRRDALDAENERYELVLETAQGEEAALVVADVVRAYPANQLDLLDKVGVYLSRWWEFLTENPREANSEGGVFPAIFGTVAMTLIMSVIVVPFGVLAALYLREYAKQGVIVSAVRIAVNNLAGVPSIVFGVFGLGFFCYILGAGIDDAFFAASLPAPTFGTGGLMWASLTLALLTLPVVIVATEEALSAVPNSMREGSYACGATKWQTIKRIVLPRAMPGIMTGMILAIARGAGEVAPLMLVGVVKLAPELPVDGVFPFVHAQRSFMHLGFHIYDVGFQSQNSEAAKPMVYTTTLLLIVIIVSLNLLAIWIRARLRSRFQGAAI